MNILGVAFLSDASAAVIQDGKLVAAISEERLNRIKQWNGIPHESIKKVLALAGLSLEDIDVVATHGAADSKADKQPFEEKERQILSSELSPEIRRFQLESLHSRYEHENRVLGERTPGYISEIRELGRPLVVVGHHEAHAACAYFASGWDECLVLTADGWGEDGSSSVWRGEKGELELLSTSHTIDSLGYFYGSVTKALGFIPHRHEGKVLGLAAYCNDPESYSVIRKMIGYDMLHKRFIGHMENGLYIPRFENPLLSKFVKEFDREDIASSTQRSLEEVVQSCVSDFARSKLKIALAGGLFANVKLNQRIGEIPNVEEIFVFPNMGDGGLSIGSAWLAYKQMTGRRPQPLRTVLLGNNADQKEIAENLAKSVAKYKHVPDIEVLIGQLVAEGNVVARFEGPMEFGPRALGNRSILCQATDPEVNDWLNQRLGRSEFMPFAPATLEEYSDECYLRMDMARTSAMYMTVTFDCTEKMKKQSPAAVHVDGTARPQVISPAGYPKFHRILSSYYRRTGIPSIINTSFNMHEEPIVSTVDDALRAFFAGNLSYLAIGDFLVEQTGTL